MEEDLNMIRKEMDDVKKTQIKRGEKYNMWTEKWSWED